MKELGTKRIETDRLILRRIKADDYKLAYENITSDPSVTKYLSWEVHKDSNETREFYEQIMSKYDNGNFYFWIVELKEDKDIIGSIDARFSKMDQLVEIGYCYGSKFWGKGYATEGLKAVINYMFEEVEVRKVIARHISTNPSSGVVMEKAGMKVDGVLKGYAFDKNTGHEEDYHMYSIDLKDYKIDK